VSQLNLNVEMEKLRN